MRQDYVGVTLLFIDRRSYDFEAVLMSFIINGLTYSDVIRELKELGEKYNVYDEKNRLFTFKYIGIEDIFQIVGPIGKGSLLGRTTIWDQSFQDAKNIISEPDKYTLHEQMNDFQGKWFLAVPVYYVKSVSKENGRIISCNCLVKSSDTVINTENLVTSNNFMEKIIRCDSENLKLNELNFIGFEDISVVYGDVQKGEPFMKMAKKFKSLTDIYSMVIHDEEIVSFFEILSLGMNSGEVINGDQT